VPERPFRTALSKLTAIPSRIILSYTEKLNKNTIGYWQAYIFYVIALVGVIAGTLCIVPSLIYLISKSQALPCVLLSFLYVVNVTTIFARRASLRVKTTIISINFTLIGAVSLAVGGPVGESGIWFATSVLFCSLFAGFPTALASAVLNLMVGVLFAVLYKIGLIGWYFLKDFSFVSWLIQCGNIFLISMTFTVANTMLIRGVNSTFIALGDTEETIKASLNEKETLIAELYHRTKNNMQIISSILSLHSSSITDESSRSVFKEIEDKIRSMSLVHQKLYQSKNLSSIGMAEYIDDLTGLLLKSYKVSPDRITIATELEDVSFSIDSAIPCGLVINEIITNTLKYAFPGDRRGKITISLRGTGEDSVELCIADDGVGFAPGFDPELNGKMGMKTIFTIVRHQLQGEIRVLPGPGAAFRIRFKHGHYSKRV
jgi:two-component sensor histidine kinase